MKKVFAFAALVAVVSLSSCGNKNVKTEVPAEEISIETTTAPVDTIVASADSTVIAVDSVTVK